MYIVEKTEIGWKCTFPDHKFRGMKCKHIWAVEISLGMRQQAKPKILLEPVIILTVQLVIHRISKRMVLDTIRAVIFKDMNALIMENCSV